MDADQQQQQQMLALSQIKRYKYKKSGDDSLLGEGRFAEVHKAYVVNPTSNIENEPELHSRPCAVKILKKRNIPEEAKKRAAQEATVLFSLKKHKRIVRLYGLGENVANRTEHGLVLEYCEFTLKEYLDLKHPHGCLDEDGEIRYLARSLQSGLYHIHLARMTHCDLKPGNILVKKGSGDRYGDLKIADFGLTQLMNPFLTKSSVSASTSQGSADDDEYRSERMDSDRMSFTFHNFVGGSPVYIDPDVEVQRRSGAESIGFSRKWDIWSYAVIVYEMYRGEPLIDPPKWDTIMDAFDVNRLQRLVNDRINKLKGSVSNNLIDLLKHCLQTDPAQRMTPKEFHDHEWFHIQWGWGYPLKTKGGIASFGQNYANLDEFTAAFNQLI